MLLSDVLNLNLGITTTNAMEENQKQVMAIYVEAIESGVFDIDNGNSGRADSLYNIATQCPITGGPAVYLARSLYAIINPDMVYDDRLACLQVGVILRKKQAVSTPPSSAYVFPNPATDRATLVYNIGEDGTFEIYNMVGQKQSMYKLQSKTHEIIFDTSKLNNGIYYFKVTCCDENVKTGKLVITR
jgi:hypothetical protein